MTKTTDHPQHAPLQVQDLTVAYHSKPVLWDVHLKLRPQTLTAIVGPNGAGKSTLLKACLGLTTKASGQVSFYGQPLQKARQQVAYVPQRESVDWDFPIQVLDVVCMGLYNQIGWLRPMRKKHLRMGLEALDRVNMADFAKRHISQLSGGQQQRVFLARALAQNASLTLLDEPFAGVDVATEQAIMTVLRDLRDDGGTVAVIHHDLQTVREHFDDVLLLNMRVIAHGSITDTFTDDNLRKTYGGRLTLLSEAASAATRQRL